MSSPLLLGKEACLSGCCMYTSERSCLPVWLLIRLRASLSRKDSLRRLKRGSKKRCSVSMNSLSLGSDSISCCSCTSAAACLSAVSSCEIGGRRHTSCLSSLGGPISPRERASSCISCALGLALFFVMGPVCFCLSLLGGWVLSAEATSDRSRRRD